MKLFSVEQVGDADRRTIARPAVAACDERRAAFVIPAALESAALARKMTGAVLSAWASTVDHAETVLLVDEVFTNAVLHGVGEWGEGVNVTVELVASRSGLHIEIHDPDLGPSGALKARRVGADTESGRGLELVEALSARWGSRDTPDGKFVYFDMAVRDAEELRVACRVEQDPAQRHDPPGAQLGSDVQNAAVQ